MTKTPVCKARVSTFHCGLTLLLFLAFPTLISSQNDDKSTRRRSGAGPELPFAFTNDSENVTVQVGSTAFLSCPVQNLGEKPISWVRRKDWKILTHGPVTFTSDGRFQLAREDGSDDWALQIKYVEARDSGIYECQVTTEDGIKSHRADLKVVTPEAFILADEEYHIDRGSSLNLVCIIEKAIKAPQYVFWYHNNRMINYDGERGITVTTVPGRKTHSQLLIKRAEVTDTGNYTCAPSSSLSASIHVFVSGSEVKPWTTSCSARSGVVSPAFVGMSLLGVLLLNVHHVLDLLQMCLLTNLPNVPLRLS